MAVKNSFSFFSMMCLISIYIHVILIPFLVEGFSVELVHRDHSKSPSHEPSKSQYERLHGAFLRSFSRKNFLKAQVTGSTKQTKNTNGRSKRQIKSFIINEAGEYLMEVSVGTLPFTFMAIVDTGSDLTWTQCEPCAQCYKQEAPIFNPSKSSSYKKLPCNTALCFEAGESSCDQTDSCAYKYSYVDGSFIVGNLANETFTFGTNSGKNISIPNIAFGCAHQNGEPFNRSGSGLFALGGGPLSMVNQFGGVINGMFSHCLVPFRQNHNLTSKISFGTSSIVSGRKKKSTPMYRGPLDTFYFLNLEGVSIIQREIKSGVGFTNNITTKTKRINVTKMSSNGETVATFGPKKGGNIIIDSGVTLTFLPRQLATDLEATLRESITGTISPDPQGLFNLCYKTGQGTTFPDIVAHFTGANIILPTFNTFLQVSDDLICFTLLGTDDLPIFGNLSQGDYLIGYNLVNGTVSFKQTDCSKVI
ncbi:OLC1v1024239C1 [Oldenlandia corymbosa var. corymbosa]|uniref:OLC1v1024239C1 n=1 Tax=Oldenlandia corymbosa var. corymbosa TaxID=529605 RepID=A0AAV1C2S2_OLDCO|nr:OLC1v1024239C1 [Oldenlandia corymbosa var. corymbosa]